MITQVNFFSGKTTVNNISQPTTTIVAETAQSKRFAFVTYFVMNDSKGNKQVKICRASTNAAAQDPEFIEVIKQIFSGYSVDITLLPNLAANGKDTVLDRTNYNVFLNANLNKFTSYEFDNKDTTGNTLKDFLVSNFVFDEIDIIKPKTTQLIVKYALPKLDSHWEDFWNSTHLSQDEKDAASGVPDLDICYSNSNREPYKFILRTLLTDYGVIDRKWFFTILHGDPASGKTTLVENLCAMYHIPCIKITGDPVVTIKRLLSVIGPESVEGKVELTQQESIWLKCIRYNLPLVVLLDEIDLFATQQMSLLADTITSGKVSVDVHNYKNVGNTIKYFGCYNPNTAKSSEFDGKFRDRALFISVAPVSKKTKTEHKQRRFGAFIDSLNPSTSSCTVGKFIEMVDSLLVSYPERSSELNYVKETLNAVSQLKPAPSEEALEWYVNNVKAEMNPKAPVFKAGKWTPYYVDDVSLASKADCLSIYPTIEEFVDTVNDELWTLTQGINTKQRSGGNNFFYIPDRSFDILVDWIFCFHSTKTAIEKFVYNMLPGGFTLNSTISTSRIDNTPSNITKSLVTVIENEAKKVDIVCFGSGSITESAIELSDMISVNCVPELEAALLAPVEQPLTGDTSTTSGSSGSSSVWDEANKVFGN